jgi:MFS transporter, AAHS family, 4-hydroxybenzoate transporter
MVMSPATVIDVTELIDRRPIGAFQIMIIVLCGLVALLDGFDLLAIGVAGPGIAATLHLAPGKLGAAFSMALLGLMVGAFAFGPLADRYGRKRALIVATMIFGVFTLCTALSTSLEQLLLYRFLAGIGFGGAMPSSIGLASEYVPRARRSTIVGLLWAGFPIGGTLVGLLASRLTGVFGWPSLFYIGGALPLVLAAVLWRLLPESINFLVTRGAESRQIARLVRRLDPASPMLPDLGFVVSDERAPGTPVRHLFTQGRTAGTCLLWASYFTTFVILVTNQAWTPTLLQGAGIDAAHAAFTVAMFAFGSVFGTLFSGFLVGRFGAHIVLPIALLASALTLGGVGYASSSIVAVTWLEGFAGVFLGLASTGLIAFTALFYPIAIRSTGLGWAMGFGRFGSFVGPLAIGWLVGGGLGIESTFAALAAPALIGTLLTSILPRSVIDQTRTVQPTVAA